MTINYISLTPNKNQPDELTPEAAKWQAFAEEANRQHHELNSYVGIVYIDSPDQTKKRSEKDIDHYEVELANAVANINQREQREKAEYIRKYGHKPTIHDDDILIAEKLEDITSQGIRQFGWLGATSPEEAYSDGYIVREIGLAKSGEQRYKITDKYGRTYTRPFDDLINKIDSAWEFATQDGQSLYLGLDFSVNNGRGKDEFGHRHNRNSLSDDREAARKRDEAWLKKIARSTNSPIKLPFGCSSITFGYTKLESATTDPNISVRIVPRYAIAIGDNDTDYAYDTVHSTGKLDQRASAAIQFKILSQIHEQNRLLIPVIGRSAMSKRLKEKPESIMTPDETRALETIKGIDKIVAQKLRSCIATLFNSSLKYLTGDERRDRRVKNLASKLREMPEDQRIDYLYEWLRDGSISLVFRDDGKTIGRDEAYDECIEMTRKFKEALESPSNYEVLSRLYGVKSRNKLPFSVVINPTGDKSQLCLE